MKNEFRFNAPKSITIGDDLYFEEYANDPKRLNELTYSQKIPPNYVGGIIIQEGEKDQDSGMPSWTEFTIVFAPDKLIRINRNNENNNESEYESLLNIYLGGLRLKGAQEKRIELGCDTASYSIFSGKNICHFHILSDGVYGYVYEYDDNNDIVIVFNGWFDTSAYDFNEVVNAFKALFNIKEEN